MPSDIIENHRLDTSENSEFKKLELFNNLLDDYVIASNGTGNIPTEISGGISQSIFTSIHSRHFHLAAAQIRLCTDTVDILIRSFRPMAASYLLNSIRINSDGLNRVVSSYISKEFGDHHVSVINASLLSLPEIMHSISRCIALREIKGTGLNSGCDLYTLIGHFQLKENNGSYQKTLDQCLSNLARMIKVKFFINFKSIKTKSNYSEDIISKIGAFRASCTKLHHITQSPNTGYGYTGLCMLIQTIGDHLDNNNDHVEISQYESTDINDLINSNLSIDSVYFYENLSLQDGEPPINNLVKGKSIVKSIRLLDTLLSDKGSEESEKIFTNLLIAFSSGYANDSGYLTDSELELIISTLVDRADLETSFNVLNEDSGSLGKYILLKRRDLKYFVPKKHTVIASAMALNL